jgi:hypothetical protein
VLGIARNASLVLLAADTTCAATAEHRPSGKHGRRFACRGYVAATWTRSRNVVVKAEHGERGENPRFWSPTSTGPITAASTTAPTAHVSKPRTFIQDVKNALRADRLSCHRFLANAVRLVLHAIAHRRHALRSERPSTTRSSAALRWTRFACACWRSAP